ncbi:hypothetical protein BDW62DRAFT_33804 [Aspergillus aurantiobrunneus]
MYLASSLGMPLRWRKRQQHPPVPFVEDEIDSLSRELDGSSHVGEPPGFEGAKARGTINQSPLILDVKIMNVPSHSPKAEEKSSRGYRPSGFDANPSTKMETKGRSKPNASRHPAAESESQGPGKPRPRSPSKPQDVHPMSQHPGTIHIEVSELNKSFPGTYQKPTSRQTEPVLRAPGPNRDALPPKPTTDVVQKSQKAPSRTPSIHRRQEQHKTSSPTRHVQPEPEPLRKADGRMSSLAKSMPEVIEKGQSAPSRASSLRRGQEQHKLSSSTRSESVPVRHPGMRTGSPPKRLSDVAEKPQPVLSRTPSGRRGKGEYKHIPATGPPRPDPARDSNMPAGSFPTIPVSGGAEKPQTFLSRPLPVPQECHNTHQQETVGDTSVRGPVAPPKQVPNVLQKSQRPLPVPSENVQYKSFLSSVPPPQSSLDTPPKTQGAPLHPLQNPPAEGPRVSSSFTVKGAGSGKQVSSAHPSTADPRPSTPGDVSDSAAIRHNHVNRPSDHSSTIPVDKNTLTSPSLSVAERLEEKLKVRREQLESGGFPQTVAAQTQFAQSKTSVSQNSEQRAPAVQLPGAWPSDLPSEPSSSDLTQFPTLEHSMEEANPKATGAPLKSALRSQSLDRTQSSSTKVTRRRTVAFAENPLQPPSQALVKVDHETALTRMQPENGSPNSSRSSSPNTGLTLSPCPRSVPVAGYQDWHTIEGLTHLDICPSCVKQMRKSRFRDRLMLSTPKPRNEPIRCAMSEPWTRLAWVQSLKKNHENLDLLLEVTRPSQAINPCTGRIINDQYWHRIIDPETGSYLPQFNVCSACVRNVRLLMPAHRDTFQRSTIPQERVCDFVTDSPRFIRYIDALDLSSNRAEQDDEAPDLKEFLAYARRKVVLRDCRRSRLIFNTWHYMPQLPEFTVCEDCYDDIVWPLAKARHPIAREFSSVMRLLPGDTESGSSREASCQLYSPRIRAKFNDAVRRDDMPFIKWMALTRYEAERRFRDRQDELLEDQRHGYECSGDLRKNLEDWKRYE